MQRSVRHSSTVDLAVAHALKSNVRRSPGGATQGAPQFLLPPPISARQIGVCPMIMAGGATLLALTSTLPCPCSSRLQSTAPELFPLLTAGNFICPALFWLCFSQIQFFFLFFSLFLDSSFFIFLFWDIIVFVI